MFSLPSNYMSQISQGQTFADPALSSDLQLYSNSSISNNSATADQKLNATGEPTFVGTIDVRNLTKPELHTGPPQEMIEPIDNETAFNIAKKQAELIKPSAKVFEIPPISTSNFSSSINASSLKNSSYPRDEGVSVIKAASSNNPNSKVTTLSDPGIFQSVTGFRGLTRNGPFPPDVQVAAGLNEVFEMVNTEGAIYKKTGSLMNSFNLRAFFGTADTDFVTDPQLLYDVLSGRWFAGISDITTHSIRLAVSTSTSPTSWKLFNIPFEVQPDNCPDRPKIGVSDDKLIVSVNNFANNCNRYPPTPTNPAGNPPEYRGAQYVVLDKVDLLAGVTPDFHLYPTDTRESSIVPVRSLSSTSTLYMVAVPRASNPTSIKLFSIGGAVPGTTVNTHTINLPDLISVPPNSPQGGTIDQIDTGGKSIKEAVWMRGKIWLTFGDACRPMNDIANRACMHVLQVDTNANTLLQNIVMGRKGSYLFFPSVTLDSSRNLAIVYGVSSSTTFPSLEAIGRTIYTSLNTVVLPQAVLTSGSSRIGDSCDSPLPGMSLPSGALLCRYGDYFGAGPDPVDPHTVWVAGQYYNTTNWSTYIVRLGIITRPPEPNLPYEEYHLEGSLLPFPCLPCDQIFLDGNLTATVLPENKVLAKEILQGNFTATTPKGRVLEGYLIGVLLPEAKVSQRQLLQGNLIATVLGEDKILQGNITASIILKERETGSSNASRQ